MTLRSWLLNDWLRPYKTSPNEVSDLFALIERDLADCQAAGLSADWRLNIAYNAALQAATIALAASGYRASREGHHYRIIQSLAFTIDAPASLIAHVDQFRKKRNIGGYERAGIASDQEAKEMFSLAKKIRDEVAAWLLKTHPELMEK
ncbi:MAG: hypothetical protein QME74_11030 [Candidatus Edwardsbacteria bacterium]|nr:hypothetical protein [Candidatus Edwardsbacteria bacterium]